MRQAATIVLASRGMSSRPAGRRPLTRESPLEISDAPEAMEGRGQTAAATARPSLPVSLETCSAGRSGTAPF